MKIWMEFPRKRPARAITVSTTTARSLAGGAAAIFLILAWGLTLAWVGEHYLTVTTVICFLPAMLIAEHTFNFLARGGFVR